MVNAPAAHPTAPQLSPFERITRQIRWLTLLLLLVTFPYNSVQAKAAYLGLALAAAYNLLRYIPAVYRNRILGSPVAVLAIDSVWAGLMLMIVGSAASAYTGLLVLMILTGAYRYGFVGVILVAGIESVVMAIATMWPLYSQLPLNVFQSAYIGILELLLIGILAVRLTRTEREEHDMLRNISKESNAKSRRLLGLVNSLNQAIYVLDSKGHVLLVNEAGRVLIPSGADPNGRKLSDVLALRRSNHPDELVDLLSGGESPQVRRDLSIIDANSQQVNLDVTIMPVPAEGSKNDLEYVILCRDITKEHSLDEQREEFISVASHELRTPLTITEAAISTALLDRKGLGERNASLLEKAHRNVVFLSGIVHDLTTLSEAQNDSIPIQLTPVSPAKLLEQLKTDFDAEAQRKQLELVVEVSPDTPAVLSTEHHIHEVLENFLTNAIKYTPKGNVVLKAEPGPNGSARFSIKDSGIGISPADQQHLFNKFFRAEDFRTRETGGTGMGLYLCLELAQRLNAKVWCESKLNQGSTFFLDVPPFSKLRRDTGEVVKAQVSSLVDQL